MIVFFESKKKNNVFAFAKQHTEYNFHYCWYLPSYICIDSMDNLLSLVDGGEYGDQESSNINLTEQAEALAQSKEFQSCARSIKDMMNIPDIKLVHEADMKKAIDKLIHDSLVFGSYSFVHKFNLAINGPRRSGKTVFAKHLFKEAVMSMALTNETETTLILTADFANPEELKGVFGLYEFLIKLIFEEISNKLSYVAGHKKKFIDHFLSLPGKDRLPQFPKLLRETHDFIKILPCLNDIAGDLIKALQDPFGLEQWFSCVAEIPRRIAEAFGFDDILWFIDHFDGSDIAVSPQVPFNEAPNSIFLSEFTKKMLVGSSYVIVSQDDERFISILPSLTDYGCDLLSSFKFFNITDMEIQRKVIRNQYDIMIDFAGDYPPLRLTEKHCGSCPGYLAIWEYIASEINKRDLAAKQVQTMYIDAIQPFLSLVFDEKTIPPTKIKAIRKVKP